jgi:hypothetical protein
VAELAYAAASRAALLWVQLPPGLPESLRSLTIQRRVGRTVRHLSAKQGLSQEANGFNSRTLRHAEGTAEWPATGPENRGIVMIDGRSIRLPSANFAQVREPGRNVPAVTRYPQVGRGGSNPPLCPMCQRARIGIVACLRNRCLRVRISPLAPDFSIAGSRSRVGYGFFYLPDRIAEREVVIILVVCAGPC